MPLFVMSAVALRNGKEEREERGGGERCIEKDSYAKRRRFGSFSQPETGNGTAETAWLAYIIRKIPNKFLIKQDT